MTITDQMLRVGPEIGGVDTCQGDSGEPLFASVNDISPDNYSWFVLVGITSFGFGCALPGYPGIYTNARSYNTWILQNSYFRPRGNDGSSFNQII